MAQHTCYADSPDMPLTVSQTSPHRDGSEGQVTAVHRERGQTLSYQRLRYISHVGHAEPDAWDMAGAVWEYLPEVCVTYKTTRSSDMYDQYQTLRHRQGGLSAT